MSEPTASGEGAPDATGAAATPPKSGSDWKRSLIAGLLGVLIGALAMAAASGFFVRRYLLAHPEIIPEAMEQLQSREMASVVDRHRAAIETPFHGAWAGARQPDVVLVEFFDYACGYCRASNPHVDRLLREDPRLRVVWREFPVLGPASEQAAIASLAAARAGRYRPFYDSLFAAGRPSEQTIAQARQATGLGEVALNDEARQELQKNFDLARALGAQGTPTFVVGDRVLQGAVGYEALRDAVAEARAARS
ncbi:MAG TPA: DsbA family protein [Allosphingosinicella sp.]|jgi:protein-disulfide isomerase